MHILVSFKSATVPSQYHLFWHMSKNGVNKNIIIYLQLQLHWYYWNTAIDHEVHRIAHRINYSYHFHVQIEHCHISGSVKGFSRSDLLSNMGSDFWSNPELLQRLTKMYNTKLHIVLEQKRWTKRKEKGRAHRGTSKLVWYQVTHSTLTNIGRLWKLIMAPWIITQYCGKDVNWLLFIIR